ncbi:MAG: CoA pyrophosphatase [Actinomycetota bacterium]
MPDVIYDEELRSTLRRHLDAHEVREHPLDGRRHAAVAIVVTDSDAALHGTDPTPTDVIIDLSMIPGDVDGLDGRVDGTAGGAAILLTRRQPRLRAHAGQWALPGGRIDAGETPVEAALRETSEEIGLDLSTDHLLGRLDDYPTRSGYVITPFVFWAGVDAEPAPNPDEVASVHRISLRELVRPDSPRFVEIPESDRPVIQLRIGQDLLHAPTGAVIHQFRAVAVEGRDERVDAYEQPVFAWR